MQKPNEKSIVMNVTTSTKNPQKVPDSRFNLKKCICIGAIAAGTFVLMSIIHSFYGGSKPDLSLIVLFILGVLSILLLSGICFILLLTFIAVGIRVMWKGHELLGNGNLAIIKSIREHERKIVYRAWLICGFIFAPGWLLFTWWMLQDAWKILSK